MRSKTQCEFLMYKTPVRANEIVIVNQCTCHFCEQFGHNDQKASANISLDEYQTNLENMAKDVKVAGGTPVRSLLKP